MDRSSSSGRRRARRPGRITTIAEVEHTPPPAQPPTEEEVAREMSKKSPMKIPWLQPQDIAPVAVFLASDEAHLVSGSTYDVTPATAQTGRDSGENSVGRGPAASRRTVGRAID